MQWCHGATGFLPLLAKLHGRVPAGGETARKLEAAADRAADVIWERGLLTKVLLSCDVAMQRSWCLPLDCESNPGGLHAALDITDAGK